MVDCLNKRGDVEWDTLIPFMIAIGVLALSFFLYMAISGKGAEIIGAIKNFLRFGG